MTPDTLSLLQIYKRALALLAPEKYLAIALAFAGVVIAAIQLAEPVLFGRVVDALSTERECVYGLIGIWAALGLFSILAGVIVATYADRLAHRQKLVQMADVFERAIALPQHYHAERGSGAVIRTILSGTSSLFWLWLGAMRDQLTALFGILLLIPTAISMDWRMAMILFALAAAYTVLNVFVMGKTSAGQAAVEGYETALSGRVVDVIGNVTVVQSYARLQAETAALKALMQDLLKAQYPVLSWWGILAVLQRAAATLTMVTIFVAGATLAGRGELTVGEIVSFVAFATLLIGKLDQLSGFVVRVHQQAPTLRLLFGLMDQSVASADPPDAKPLPPVAGNIHFDDVSYRYGSGPQGVYDVTFTVKGWRNHCASRADGSRKIHRHCAVAALPPAGQGPHRSTMATTSRMSRCSRCASRSRSCSRTPACSIVRSERTFASASRTRPTQKSSAPQHLRKRTPSSRKSQAATISSSASAAPRCLAASASAFQSHALF